MARTHKADILARGRRHAEGIPGRDAKPRINTPEWREYYRRAEARANHRSNVRRRAGWSDAPSYIYPPFRTTTIER